MTLEDFTPIFVKLASQLSKDADADTIRDYFDIMQEFSTATTHEAAAQLSRTAKWFPKTSEWRERGLTIEQDQRRKELAGPRSWKLECETCEDTGWIYFECPAQPCDRDRAHYPHNYVRVCPCRTTNRTYQRHHAVAVKA